MTKINLTTHINSTIEKCFDLSRDIDIHLQSASKTHEKVYAGRKSGLCELGDEITWEAVHFGIRQKLSIKITQMENYVFFEDTMTKGAFNSMRHEHYFESHGSSCIMRDIFYYEVPYSIFGIIFDKIILKKYMTKFLIERNQTIKKAAELAEY